MEMQGIRSWQVISDLGQLAAQHVDRGGDLLRRGRKNNKRKKQSSEASKDVGLLSSESRAQHRIENVNGGNTVSAS